uniref:J domain-containing protein n=1 Tax=viral metagenome TaxID=1070528 RepID=A0A6C0ANQ5_9ZZZZ
MSRNLYSVLGVSKNAETAEIRTAYKQLAKEHHPDKGGDPEKFKELSEAHEVLSDDGRRRLYDQTGSISEQPQGQNPFQGGGFGMPDMFSHMFGGMFPGGPMGGMGQGPGMGGPGQRKREGKGPSKNQEIPLRLIDFYQGRSLSIKLGRQCFCKGCKGSGGTSSKPCDHCGGRGQLNQVVQMGPIQMVSQTTCPPCGGKGQQTLGKCASCSGRGMSHEEKTMEVKVEPGMMSGNTIVFPGMCSDHPSFTDAGDVTVILRESDEDNADTAQWSREGSRLKITVTVGLSEALLGTIKMVKGHPGYPNGLPLEIPVGVQNMWSGTFSGLGMPIRGTPRFGDAIITVLVTPTDAELVALKANGLMMRTFMPVQGPDLDPNATVSLNVGKWTA